MCLPYRHHYAERDICPPCKSHARDIVRTDRTVWHILIIFCVKFSQDATLLALQKFYTSLVSSASYSDPHIQPYRFNRSTKIQEIVAKTFSYVCSVFLLLHYSYIQIMIV